MDDKDVILMRTIELKSEGDRCSRNAPNSPSLFRLREPGEPRGIVMNRRISVLVCRPKFNPAW